MSHYLQRTQATSPDGRYLATITPEGVDVEPLVPQTGTETPTPRPWLSLLPLGLGFCWGY